MKTKLWRKTLFAVLIVMAGCSGPEPSRRVIELRSDAPAAIWEETFPLGNGRIGLMPDGGIQTEKYVMNEISTWTGSKENVDNPEALSSLGRIRELLFENRNDEAQELITRTFVCGGHGTRITEPWNTPFGSYQLFANMVIDYDRQSGEVSDYSRVLDLENAVATVSYTQGGVHFTREVITARGADVGVVRLSADKPGSVGFALSLNRESNTDPGWGPEIAADGQDLTYRLRLHSGTEGSQDVAPTGMRLGGRVRVVTPGAVSVRGDSIVVKDADEALIFIAMHTDYFGDDPDAKALAMIEQASLRSWDDIVSEHGASHRELFDRVDLDLGHNPAKEALTTARRLEEYEKDHDDPSLMALYYQYGRYLLISTTREGSLPPNLQGLWAQTIKTPWTGDYHLNINLQMNFWPAESGNLSELHMPLVDWTETQIESGRHTAQSFYGARGWVSHIRANLWEYTAPGDSPSWGATNTCAAWLCEHLYMHYLYNPDRSYLERIYPTMREAALFFTDMLVEDPRSHYLVTAPTTSPENSYNLPNGNRANVCAGSTMDNQIVRELFTNVIEAASILGVDDDFTAELADKRSRLQPTTIGEDGRIMEWLEPFEERDIHHRHVSHLYGLYPGNEISRLETPELAEAARKTLEVRGDESTGWSMAWKICFWARLQDGERAWKLLGDLLHPASSKETNYSNGGGSYPNLFCAHPPYQIDGNLGGAAGIAEMLLQSQTGAIELLPALPEAWKTGSFSGLCARGGAEMSASWEDGQITRATLKARHAGSFYVVGLMDKPVELKAGQVWKYKK